MIPKSGLPVFGKDHAQKGEAERRKAHAIHCPRDTSKHRCLLARRGRAPRTSHAKLA